jgi:hypothetical protein
VKESSTATPITPKPKWRVDEDRRKERMANDPAYRKLYHWKRNQRRKLRLAKDPIAKADYVQRKRHRLWAKKRAIIAAAKGDTCSRCGAK